MCTNSGDKTTRDGTCMYVSHGAENTCEMGEER